MDFITIEISHANFGVWITICTIHPTDALCPLHGKSVTTYPKASVTTCPNVVSLTTFVIVEKYVVSYILRVMYKVRYIYIYIYT